MIPKGERAALLACDTALDRAVVRLYRSSGTAQSAACRREFDRARRSLRIALAKYRVAPGDLRR